MQRYNVIPISVFIITLDEEHNIGAALNRLLEFDEVVLVDSGSTDQTVEIARRYPNVKVFHQDWPGFSAQKEYAKSLCKNSWVLNIDADELVSTEFLEFVRKEVSECEFNAIRSRRTLLRWGKAPRHFGKDEQLIRLFRKSAGHYEHRRVHESVSVRGEVGETSATIYHCENLSLTERVDKSNLYSRLRALDKFENGNRISLLAVFFAFPIYFIQLYLIKGHILSGADGFITSMNAAFYSFMKYAKLWEMHQEKNRNETLEEFHQFLTYGTPREVRRPLDRIENL